MEFQGDESKVSQFWWICVKECFENMQDWEKAWNLFNLIQLFQDIFLALLKYPVGKCLISIWETQSNDAGELIKSSSFKKKVVIIGALSSTKCIKMFTVMAWVW